MIPEAALEQTEHDLLPASDGWYVLNARDAPWSDRAGCAHDMVKQGEADFAQLGVGLCVLEPGGPMSMYHWETDQGRTSSCSPARHWPSSKGGGR